MIHPRYRIAPIALAVGWLCASAVALAGLKAKPPEGVTLAGIEWQLDKYNSDDASEAVDRAGRKQPTISNRVGQDDDDPFGRNSPTRDPIGRRTPGPLERANPSGGGWGRGGANSADIDPIGNQSVQMSWGNTTRGSLFFESLRKNPEKLSFSEGKQYVTVNEDGLETECEAGTKAPFSDSYGDGTRECGWSGRAWVVETTRPRQFRRTDRYELSKDGKTLKYTTTASEEGVGRVTISRRYQLPPSK